MNQNNYVCSVSTEEKPEISKKLLVCEKNAYCIQEKPLYASGADKNDIRGFSE